MTQVCVLGNPNEMFFYVGFDFKSGALRIIEIEKVKVAEQIKHH